MQILSTDQPPFILLASQGSGPGGVGLLSTDQPPKQQTQERLLALSSGAALAPLDFWRVRQMMDDGKVAQISAARSVAYPVTQEQRVELERLSEKSKDVVLMLATADLWAATRVSGTPWSATAGIAASSVSMVPPVSPPQPNWQHEIAAVTHADYLDSVMEVAATMGRAPPQTLQFVKAQAGMPHIYLPLALGMGDKPQAWPYTCLVIDAVQAVVTVAVHRLKHLLLVPRPDDKVAFPASGVEPLIPTPGYTAYPSGHAALMSALSTVLGSVVEADGGQQAQLDMLAFEVAVNRERAGLHSHLDTMAGMALGQKMAQWMIDAVDHPAFGPWSAVYAGAAAEWFKAPAAADAGAVQNPAGG